MAPFRYKGLEEMKILSWNVNGLRACEKKGFKEFFLEENADIFALQESKLQPEQLPDALHFEGYHLYINSAERKGYSGTMVYSRKEPLSVQYEIEGDDTKEGRVITLEFEDFWFVTAYVPNSKDGLARLDWRMNWEDHLRAHLMKLDQSKPVVYTGDLNVAHEEMDLKNPSTNHMNPGFSDQERDRFTQLLDSGFNDTFRTLCPDEVKYSWWSYRFNARNKGIGWRIDYVLVSKRIMDKVKEAWIYDHIQGSDHCPVGIELTELSQSMIECA